MNQLPDKSVPAPSEAPPVPTGGRQRISAAWRLWRPRLRIAGRATLALSILAALWSVQWRETLSAIWITLNIGYATISTVWVTVHGRAVWRTRDSALRWAICSSVFSALLFYTFQYKQFVNTNVTASSAADGEANHSIWLLLVWFLLFCAFLLLALLGAAGGAFAGRRSGDNERSARMGITLSMAPPMAFMFALIINLDSFGADIWGLGLVFSSFPLLTRLYIHTLQSSGRSLHHVLRPITRALTSCLVWRGRIPERLSDIKQQTRKTHYKLDFRGIALGFAIAFLLLHIPDRFKGPLQSLALTTLTHLHASRSLPSNLTAKLPRVSGPRDRFIILRMDAQTRYDAEQRSEAAVQADMIDLLRKRGVAQIILPLPYLYNRMIATWTSRDEGLAPDAQDVEHNRRDTRRLADVLRRSSSILLSVPPALRADDAKVQLLTNAAPVGDAALQRSSAAYLPIVPETWTGNPPLPALLCARLKTPSSPAQPAALSPQPTSLRAIPGCAKPQVYPDSVLIDFSGEGPREDFLHATYAEIRANAPLLSLHTVPADNDPPPAPAIPKVPPASGSPNSVVKEPTVTPTSDASKPPREAEGEWKPAADLLRGRVVFLDSLPHPMVFTPAGVLTQAEAQAYATSTLLSQEAFQRAPPFVFSLLTLLLGMLVGYTCARHEPLDAGIRLLIPLFLVIAGSIGAFLAGGYWLDPVIPLLTMGATAALATQFRFARERSEKQRASQLFGRFVSPHMVHAWLEQHEEELGMGGSREKICVLFADVRQFTSFAEQHDATEVIEVINAYMTALTDALHAHGGILDKYTGDGLMAFFQISNTPQEDIARAVRAALAMREAVQILSAQQAQDGKPVLNLGISLHYGDAIVGLVGNPKQQVNYTAMGLTVVVAARLQTIAGGGDIIVSEEVYQETQDAFVFAAGEPVQVKGLTQSVRPYRVLSAQQE